MADCVMVLATGGTIAGIKDKTYASGYEPGVLSVDELISDRTLHNICKIKTKQICNLNSDDITSSIWISLADTINSLSDDDSIKGFVITHGTDTLEETAFFLYHTVKTQKPVVITGSMRPADSNDADGPQNLYDAVKTAYSDDSFGRGVLVTFAGKIYSAYSVFKAKSQTKDAFDSYPGTILGKIDDGQVSYYINVIEDHVYFDLNGLDHLPEVGILPFYTDADPYLLKIMEDRYDGIVIDAAGAGEYSKGYIDAISKIHKPVVICSRLVNGCVNNEDLLNTGAIPGFCLSAKKAAVLLRLSLTIGNNTDEIRKIFTKDALING